ncbi:hypothetical protein HF521_008543 [Silurus meridionalis]|uniref:SAP domain-containing protein n=2 Tax=Silurus meridionalis TaxID=175797 RepID=A0A8T0AP56_SILME|nr:hypothetical protein HF521_008543 [Silurus meridionalis]
MSKQPSREYPRPRGRTSPFQLKDYKLAELKQECAIRGLEVKGNKGDLIARLQAYIDEHDVVVNEEDVLEEFTEEAAAPETKAPEEAPEAKAPEESPAPEAEAPKDLPAPDTEATKKVIKINLSELASEVYIEKMRKRAERFGMSVSPVYKKFPEEEKLKKRKERFGTVTSAASVGAYYLEVYIEKMRKRAERFGMIVSPVYKKFLEEEKLKKRKDRFGIVTSAASVGANDSELTIPEAKKQKRVERFGNV